MFKIKYIIVVYKDNIILLGWINHQNKWWHLPLPVKNEDKQVGEGKNTLVNNVDEQKTQAELETFLHSTCLILVESTLIKAVKHENLATCPGLTAKLISKRIPKSEATTFGNLDQTQQNTSLTKREPLSKS